MDFSALDGSLPAGVTVSTISFTFSLASEVDLQKTLDYLPLSPDEVRTVTYEGFVRTVVNRPKKAARARRRLSSFYNCIVVEVACPRAADAGAFLHVKVFRNGSVQVAGCREKEPTEAAVATLCALLEETYYTRKEGGGVEEHRLLRGPCRPGNLKVNLINTTFKLGVCVHRRRLHQVLMEEGVPTAYDTCKHTGVQVLLPVEGKTKPVTLLVFERGSVVITGAKCMAQVTAAHDFIRDFLTRRLATPLTYCGGEENNKRRRSRDSTDKRVAAQSTL